MAARQPRPIGSRAAGGGGAQRVRPLACPPEAAAGSGLREAEPARPLPKSVVELGASGRRRAVQLGGGNGGIGHPSVSGGDGSPAPLPSQPSQQDVTSTVEGYDGSPLAAVRAFFLPTGWPGSVTPDYLQYQLISIPTHITGWCSHSLATSSMIQALGVGAGPATVVATSAAIKWITKDGLGAAGRLIVGGRLASVFDEDPRRWRMMAEGVSTLGLALEIATQLSPANFVALAGAGTLAKSMAKGMGRPCFRVIQTHFSATNNVGDVAAKEEVWEVAAQLAGLASSVALLQLVEGMGRPETVVPAWLAVHSMHVGLRYLALSALRFPYPNQKRAALLASGHVSSGRVPSIEEANAGEQLLLPPSACRPRVHYGCTLEEALGSRSGQQLGALVQLYRRERYMLTWHSGAAWVLLQQEAGPLDMLRAMWQAAWLDNSQQQEDAGKPAASTEERLAASLAVLQQQWPDFEAQAALQGWQLDKAVLPQGPTRLRLE